MELYDLQNEINKLYDKNYKLKTVDYNYLSYHTKPFLSILLIRYFRTFVFDQ